MRKDTFQLPGNLSVPPLDEWKSRRTVVVCLVALCLLAGAAAKSYSSITQFSGTMRQLVETVLSHSEVQAIAVDFEAMESARRAYLILQDPTSRPSTEKWQALWNRVEAFRRAETTDPLHAQNNARFKEVLLAAKGLGERTEEAVAAGAGKARIAELLALGQELSSKFRNLIDEADRASDRAAQARSDAAQKAAQMAALLVLGLTLLGNGGLALALWAILSAANRRRRAERERVRALVREQEALKRALDAETGATEILETIGAAFVAVDGQFRFTYVNTEFQRMFDKHKDEVFGKTPFEVFPERTGTEWDRSLHAAMATRTPATFEFHKTSSNDWFQFRVFPNPHTGGLSYFIQDVTKAKRAQHSEKVLVEELNKTVQLFQAACTRVRSSEQLLRAIIEGSNDSIAAIDAEFHFLAFNRSYETRFLRIFHRMVKVGQRAPDVYAGSGRAATIIAEWRRALSGEEFTIQQDVDMEESDPRTYEIRYNPIRDGSGTVIGASQTCRDITERKQSELALKETNRLLGYQVQERTRELQAEAVLLQELHHRVKNNLNIISSLLNMQGRLVKNETAREALRESENRVLSMALIHDLLHQSPGRTQVELIAYLRKLIDHLAASFGTAGIQQRVSGEGTAFLALEKAIPCGLLVNELVSNCYKHAFPNRRGQIAIHVACDGDRVTLTITDNGVGLPPNFKIDGRQSLGLKLVETLATRQLRGTLEFSGGVGTTVRVKFDAGEEPEAASCTESSGEKASPCMTVVGS